MPPLRVPRPGSAAGPPLSVAACESAQLFAARAAARVPGFTIDDENAEAIAAIVQRLDGLPLAIELAAARVKLLPPEAILARLEHSLGLLVGGGRDVPDRQRTLRATIAWSYDLLSEGARRLLAACSVFRGGIGLGRHRGGLRRGRWTSGVPVLDALQELVDHSLLRLAAASAPVPRYSMLETVREFAAERLRTMPEADAVHAAHAAQFRRLADGSRPSAVLAGPGTASTCSSSSTTTSARPWTGTREHDPAPALAAGQPADRVLVRARALLGGQAAARRAARAGARTTIRRWIDGHERRGVARDRPGRLRRSRTLCSIAASPAPAPCTTRSARRSALFYRGRAG